MIYLKKQLKPLASRFQRENKQVGIFQDESYDKLDWVSQAIEPIESDLNDVLKNMPDSIPINVAFLKRQNAWNDEMQMDVTTVLRDNTTFVNMTYMETQLLADCFKFVVDGDPVVNFVESTITNGTISLVKSKQIFTDEDLKGILGVSGRDEVARLSYNELPINRCNEILDILGKSEDSQKSRSVRNKRQAILMRLVQIFKDNEWNVKNVELSNKVGHWIRDYIETGNLASMGNLAKLKVMTHIGLPIYSMKEIE